MFSDTKSAVKYLKNKNNRSDLLVLDLAMSNIEGTEFFKIVREKHPETKILVSSSYSIEIQKMIVFNADGYFDKSDGNNALLGKVEALIH
jgi:DNA-binding NarL/FixJ family response regulator